MDRKHVLTIMTASGRMTMAEFYGWEAETLADQSFRYAKESKHVLCAVLTVHDRVHGSSLPMIDTRWTHVRVGGSVADE